MKNYIANIIFAAVLTVLIFGVDAIAQGPTRVVATIPFEFNVGNEMLPAGNYEFTNLNRQAYPGSLIVRSTDRAADRSIIVPAMANDSVKADDEIGLVFKRYGSTYFLSRIDLRSSNLAVRLAKTSAERRLEKEAFIPVAVLIRTAVASKH